VWTTSDRDTVCGVMEKAVADNPASPFIDIAGQSYTYAQVWELSRRRAAGLAALGLAQGETLVCILDNNIDAITSWFAANILGAIWVPVNTALKGEFLRHQISDAGARIIVAEEDYARRVAAIAGDLPAVTDLLVRGNPPAATGIQTAELDSATSASGLTRVVESGAADPAMLIYTSGTTGPSKGCIVSHNYVCNVARKSAMLRDPAHTVWTPLPLFHLNAAGTSVLATAVNCSTVAIAPRFSLSGFWPEIRRTGAREVSVLGVMIPLIANMAESEEMKACYGQIDAVRGAPWSPELIATWKRRFGVNTAGSAVFGLTEATFITSTPAGLQAPLGASGRLNDDFDVRIVDGEDVEVPRGKSGEVLVRPRKPHVMFSGYWRRPEATLATFTNLWFHTGDIGRFDDDGWFWFVDRKKDYLRRRGENISSVEMENSFRGHPAIADVAVHAVPSEFSEDDVKVTATLREGVALAEDDLCRWSLERLPYFAVPRYIEFRKELPRNATGKVLKHQLRTEGVTDTTWDMEKSDIRVVKR
jgi:carnitine-CoA ligase